MSVISGSTTEIYIRTILLVFSWLISGLCSEIIGPAMSILAYNTQVTYNGIASALASGAAGGLLANIFCGICQKLVSNHQDLMLAMAFFLRALLAGVTPFVHSLMLLCIVFFFQGIAGSFANIGGTNLLFELWDTRVAAPLNMVHFGYGSGAVLANLLVRLFLQKPNLYHNVTVSSQLNSTLFASTSTPVDMDIRGPYLIITTLCFLIGVGHFVFCMHEYKKIQDKAKKQQMDYAPVSTISSATQTLPDKSKFSSYSPATCGHGYFGYGLTLSLVFTLYMFFVAGTDQTFAKFYFSYLKFDKFGISTNGASWGTILFWLSFSIGRLIGAIESIFIPTHICLIIAWCGGLILAVVWIICVWILGLTSTRLFVLGSLTGLIIAPLFPVSFAWIKEKLHVTPALLATILCGCGLGSLILQKIAGFVMDRNPSHFPTLLTACIVVTIVLYIILNVIVVFHQRTLKNKQHPIANDVPSTTEKYNEEEEQMASYLQGVNETL